LQRRLFAAPWTRPYARAPTARYVMNEARYARANR
jgi:hypothetical protein